MVSDDSLSMRLGFVVEVIAGDVLAYEADVLAVKCSPDSDGLGAQVREYLGEDAGMLPQASEYRFWPGQDGTRAGLILMIGAPPRWSLRYPQLRDLGRRFLEALWEQGVDVRHLATTVEGIRAPSGLDETEAFRSLLLGLADAYESGHYPPTLERVTFVEQDKNRVRLLEDALREFLPRQPSEARQRNWKTETGTMSVMAGTHSFSPEHRKPEADETTPHIFVAMPFREDYDDQYYLAMQPVVHEMGFLSERMDLDTFTGDIVDRMLARIRRARLVIALLDGANPNVYLEVGYAWGVETPTVLVAHEDEPLPFDVRGHRVLIYDKIYRLKQMLSEELRRLLG
ncbi:MAG: hypothetical protein JW966_03825 [Anaerolineae bacterium]|nr:hypothetical protein [Anaerolineae bacterium]